MNEPKPKFAQNCSKDKVKRFAKKENSEISYLET